MFWITKDPSSGSLVQYLAKITRMVLSCPLTWTWSALWQRIVTPIVYVVHRPRQRTQQNRSCNFNKVLYKVT